MPRSEKKKRKGLRKITGRSLEVGTPAAAEPRSCGIDTAGFHPFCAGLLCIERHVDGVSQFMGYVEGQQLGVVSGTSVNLDAMFTGDGHCANPTSRRLKDDLVL